MTRTIDNSFRIGRCNSCHNRPAFAWRADSGLRLDDVRCPRCGCMLDRTSREVRYITTFTEELVWAQRSAAIARSTAQASEYRETAAAWQEQADAGIDVERSEFHAGAWERRAVERENEIVRMRKAEARDRKREQALLA